MPYRSMTQERFFNANKDKIGSKVVNEFNKASKGKDLPIKTYSDRAIKMQIKKGLK
jgi:hypothetical protein